MGDRETRAQQVFVNLQKAAQGFYGREEASAAMPRTDRMAKSMLATPADGEAQKQPSRFDLQARFSAGFEKGNAVAIPTFAAWFDPQTIHRIEVDSLPEFFSGHPRKTAQAYKQLRNGVISLFHQAPAKHLPLSTSLSRLAGEACAITRVHTFLEHWGIINFAFHPQGQDLSAATPINGNTDYAVEPKVMVVEGETERLVRLSCTACGERVSGKSWTTDRGEVRFLLCDSCFGQQRFPRLFVASDFKPVSSGCASSTNEAWTDERQLEFVRAFKEIGCNPTRLKELEAQFGDASQLLTNFLEYPLRHFKPIMRLSNNSIENLFKRRERPLAFDSRPDEALLETMMLLRLWFDYAEEDCSPRQGTASSADGAVAAFVGRHRKEILGLKEQLLARAENVMRGAEAEALSEIREINLLQMQKIEVKMRFLAEHQKSLLHSERVLLIEQNEALVNAYLQ